MTVGAVRDPGYTAVVNDAEIGAELAAEDGAVEAGDVGTSAPSDVPVATTLAPAPLVDVAVLEAKARAKLQRKEQDGLSARVEYKLRQAAALRSAQELQHKLSREV